MKTSQYIRGAVVLAGMAVAVVLAWAAPARAFESAYSAPPPPAGFQAPVGGSISVIFGYDDNVPLVPDGSPFYPGGAREGYPFAGLALRLHAARSASETPSFRTVIDLSLTPI